MELFYRIHLSDWPGLRTQESGVDYSADMTTIGMIFSSNSNFEAAHMRARIGNRQTSAYELKRTDRPSIVETGQLSKRIQS